MNASSLLRMVERDGVRLALESDSKIKAYGPPQAIRKWAPAIQGQKVALISELGSKSKTAKTAKKIGWEGLADLPQQESVPAPPLGATVDRCACGSVGIIGVGWFLRSPAEGKWFCSPCYLRREGR